MASFGILHLLVIVIIAEAVTSDKAFVTLKCKSESVVELGHPGLLDCSLQLSAEASDVNIRILTWKRKGDNASVLHSIRGPVEMKPGYGLADQQWNKTLNVSLLITTTTVAHDGEYTCFVSTDRGISEANINLKVTAKYSPPKVYSIPEKIVEDRDNTLVCESAGGYPQGELRWYDADEKDWTASSRMEAKKMENGCFSLSSKLLVLRGSTYYKYTCVVFNASGIKEAEAPFNPPSRIGGPSEQPNLVNIVAPVLVIGSLIVGLLLALLVCRKRRAQLSRRLSTRPLMNRHDHRQVRQEDDNVEEGDCQKLPE